jgi:putative component of toxin-antitoxin plasmid stabilization module
MIELRGYADEAGRRRFAEWFERLNGPAAAKVGTTLVRLEHGNFSNVKGVGSGIFSNVRSISVLGIGFTLGRTATEW